MSSDSNFIYIPFDDQFQRTVDLRNFYKNVRNKDDLIYRGIGDLSLLPEERFLGLPTTVEKADPKDVHLQKSILTTEDFLDELKSFNETMNARFRSLLQQLDIKVGWDKLDIKVADNFKGTGFDEIMKNKIQISDDKDQIKIAETARDILKVNLKKANEKKKSQQVKDGLIQKIKDKDVEITNLADNIVIIEQNLRAIPSKMITLNDGKALADYLPLIDTYENKLDRLTELFNDLKKLPTPPKDLLTKFDRATKEYSKKLDTFLNVFFWGDRSNFVNKIGFVGTRINNPLPESSNKLLIRGSEEMDRIFMPSLIDLDNMFKDYSKAVASLTGSGLRHGGNNVLRFGRLIEER